MLHKIFLIMSVQFVKDRSGLEDSHYYFHLRSLQGKRYLDTRPYSLLQTKRNLTTWSKDVVYDRPSCFGWSKIITIVILDGVA